MSQVVITKDQLSESRNKSLLQERAIAKESIIKKWQKSDANSVLTSEKLLGIAFTPVFLFWGFICTLLSMGVAVCLALFRVMAFFWPSR